MKEVQVIAWCSNAVAHGSNPRAARAEHEITLSVDGSKPRVLDLCNDCDDTLGDTLRTAAEMGEPVQAKPKRKPKPRSEDVTEPEVYVCKACKREFNSPAGLAIHRGRAGHD